MKAISLDKAGRVVLPKDLRDKLRLEAGDELLVEEAGEQIVLRPVRAQATLRKERGVWVYQGARGAQRFERVPPRHFEAIAPELAARLRTP